MSYKLGLPYQLNDAFYINTMLDHYQSLLATASKKHIEFINAKIVTLNTSLLQISN